jgi:catechol 2,3-dioxygenase-like lactoylglutathione lyase family enzyme
VSAVTGQNAMVRMAFDRIDHVVFTVREFVATCNFYARVLGLRVLTFDDGRRTLQLGQCTQQSPWRTNSSPA